MKLSPPAALLLRWLGSLFSASASAYFLHLTAYHLWSAGGPPSSRPDWHLGWSGIFLFTALFSASTSIILVFAPKIFRRKKLNNAAAARP
jgi:hypothetical protein